MLVMEMSNKKQQIPTIRFKGFTDTWEQRKLMETNTSFTDGNYGESYPSGNDMSDSRNGVPFLRGSNLKNGKLDNSGANYITLEKHKELTSGHLVYDDIVIAVRGSLGALGYVDIDNVDWNINSQLAIIRTDKSELNGAFVIQFLSSNKGQKELLSRQTGTALKQLPIKQLQDVPVPKPELAEQNKISEFFRQLDDTIALHQRQLDNYKELKKAMLQKMFPQEGEKVPEVRFDGFTEEWEQRKVFDMSEITFGGGTPKTGNEGYWQGNFPWIQSSDLKNDQLCNVIPTKFITDEAINKSATKVVPANSIAVVTRVGVGKLAFMPYPYATSQDFLSLSNLKVDPWFGVYSLYVLIQKEINNIQGTSIKGMTKSDLLSKNITIPFVLEEQTKIGNFFKKLDDTIALHQQKVNDYQQLKKVILQQMFV